MTAAMKAAFTLTLEDKLSSGMKTIQDQLDRLRDKGAQLTLGKLERADDVLRAVGRQVENLTNELQRTERAADNTWRKLKGIASTSFQNLKAGWQNTWGPQGRVGGQIGVIGGIVSGVSLLKPVQSYADFQNVALHSAITKGLSGRAATDETNRLMGVFKRDALEAGQTSLAVAQAYQDLIQTGINPAQAEKLLPTHSRAATAYNITPEALGHAVFALSDSFKIDEHAMPGALAAMALASKEGRFKVEDFSMFLPSIGGNMAKLGMTGRESADRAFAALETVMKYSATPGTGFADYTSFLNDIVAPHSARMFALHNRGMAPETKEMLNKYHIKGVNLPALLEDARNKGIDPITAVLRTLDKITSGLPADVKGEVLGAFFGNSESRNAAMAMLDHLKEMEAQRAGLGKADAGMLNRDFTTAHNAPITMLRTGEEAGTQLERRAGEGFEPVVRKLTEGLEGVVHGIERVDTLVPHFADAVFSVTAGLLALATTLGTLGFIAPAVSAGWGLLGAGASAAGGASLLIPGAAAVALKIGSDAETPENRAALDQLAKERRSLAGGPNGATFDGYGPDGQPVAAAPPAEPPKGELNIIVKTDPGTSATVDGWSEGMTIRSPNPGVTVNRP